MYQHNKAKQTLGQQSSTKYLANLLLDNTLYAYTLIDIKFQNCLGNFADRQFWWLGQLALCMIFREQKCHLVTPY